MKLLYFSGSNTKVQRHELPTVRSKSHINWLHMDLPIPVMDAETQPHTLPDWSTSYFHAQISQEAI